MLRAGVVLRGAVVLSRAPALARATKGIDKHHVNRLGWQAIHEATWLGADTPTYQATVRDSSRAASSATVRTRTA